MPPSMYHFFQLEIVGTDTPIMTALTQPKPIAVIGQPESHPHGLQWVFYWVKPIVT